MFQKKWIYALISVALIISATVGLFVITNQNSDDTDENSDLVRVTTSFYPIYDFTKGVVGDKAVVNNVLPAGADAHDYEPSTAAIRDILDSDILFYNGNGIEPWVERLRPELDAQNVMVVKMTDNFDLLDADHDHSHNHSHDEDKEHSEDDDHDEEKTSINKTDEVSDEEYEEMHSEDEYEKHSDEEHSHNDEMHSDEKDHSHDEDKEHSEDDDHDHGDKDPHIWLDPVLAIEQVNIIKDKMIEIDPDNESSYTSNAADYINQLEDLDSKFTETLNSCSLDAIVTSHNAFSYLAVRYGFEVYSVSGLSPDETPSVARLAELSDLVESEGIEYVFFDSLVSSRVAETLAEETGSKVLVLNPLEGLSQDEVDSGANYISIMEQNLTNISTALKCD